MQSSFIGATVNILEAKKLVHEHPELESVQVDERWWYAQTGLLGPSIAECTPGLVGAEWLREIQQLGTGAPPGKERGRR